MWRRRTPCWSRHTEHARQTSRQSSRQSSGNPPLPIGGPSPNSADSSPAVTSTSCSTAPGPHGSATPVQRSTTVAGSAVSGYWLGLTAGRFLISPIATRLGASSVAMVYVCLAGITAAAALVWLAPIAALAVAALALLGFFLGPVFPTTIAMAPQLTAPRSVP